VALHQSLAEENVSLRIHPPQVPVLLIYFGPTTTKLEQRWLLRSTPSLKDYLPLASLEPRNFGSLAAMARPSAEKN